MNGKSDVLAQKQKPKTHTMAQVIRMTFFQVDPADLDLAVQLNQTMYANNKKASSNKGVEKNKFQTSCRVESDKLNLLGRQAIYDFLHSTQATPRPKVKRL